MAESSSLTAGGREPSFTNWTELPDGLMASIFSRLRAMDILMSVQMVCKAWRNICKDPITWRRIDMRNDGFMEFCLDLNRMWLELDRMCRHVIDLSSGNFLSIHIEKFATDDLLQHITQSSRHIRQLCLIDCRSATNKGMSEMATKLPLLEDLEIASAGLEPDTLEVFGRSCPLLKSLKLEQYYLGDSEPVEANDEIAHAIARTMPGLLHLTLFAYQMTDDGVKKILGGCPHLESLDVSRYFNSDNQLAHLRRTGAQQIKALKFPLLSNNEYHFTDLYLDDEYW